jgi:anaerobic selenocysteine-containing dehydrogenase
MDSTHFRTCPLCEATCGLEVTLRDGAVHRIRGDRDDVFSHGFICPKGSTLGALHDDPDRLRRPLVRRDGRHVEVDWDEAFAEVEARLVPIRERHGADSVAMYLGNPNAHTIAGAVFVRPLIQALATKNLYSASTVDQMPRHVSSGLLFGNPGAMPVPDLDRTELLVILGADPLESNGSLCTAPDFPGRLAAIRDRGGRIVVVDPRRSRTAAVADEHLSIRPGTDAAWLLSLIHVVLRDGRERISLSPVSGIEHLGALVEPFSPERVAPVCGIDAATTERIAHELSDGRRSAVYTRIGTHTARHGTLCSWAADVLCLITDNLDVPGGMMWPTPCHGRPVPADRAPGGRGFRTGRWSSRVSGHPEVRGELPVAALAEEIETPGDGQVRALITVAGNPARSTPDSVRLERALASLDLVVSVDIYLNETTRYADVILPPPSALEKSHFDFAFYGLSVRNIANYSPPVLEATGPGEHEILSRLALIVSGQGASADPELVYGLVTGSIAQQATTLEGGRLQGRDPGDLVAAVAHLDAPERCIDLMVRTGPFGDQFGEEPGGLSLQVLLEHPHGVDLGALEPRLREVLRTASGTIEVDHERLRTDAAELAATLGEEAGDDLVLVGRRHVRSNNSWMHNLDVLVRGRPRCTLLVHPEDAERLGLTDGGVALVRSRVGTVEAPVEVSDAVRPGVVSLPHGWGHDADGARLAVAARNAGVNSNVLTDGAVLDPLSGNAALNAIPVTVSPT